MLKANKSAWFDKIFSIYNRNLINRRFHSLKIENLRYLTERDKSVPLILYANHSSWWDGLIGYQIWRECGIDGYVMMEEKQLKDLPLFRRLGAFSVIRENPREAVRSLNYAVDLLREKPNRALWIFPQGKIAPNDMRPLNFYNGMSRVVEKTEACSVILIAMRYEFLNEYKPEVFVKIGHPEKFWKGEIKDSKKLTENFEKRMTETLDSLKSKITNGETSDYVDLF